MIDRRIRERAERVGQHVARPQRLHHFLVGRRRKVDMAHQRHADFVRGLQRDVERRDAVDARSSWRPTRTLMPTIRSRFASATSTASVGAISRISSLSPTITVLEKP